MEKGLVRLLLSVLTFFTFTSYNPKFNSPTSLIKTLNNIEESYTKDKTEIYIPFEKELRAIEEEKSIPWIYDCKNKAVKYQNILKKNNEISYIANGWIPNYRYLHARVYVFNKKAGTWHMIDPTWEKGQDGLPVKYYKNWQVHFIFNKDVTQEDIKNERNYIAKCRKNKKTYREFKKNLDNKK